MLLFVYSNYFYNYMCCRATLSFFHSFIQFMIRYCLELVTLMIVFFLALLVSWNIQSSKAGGSLLIISSVLTTSIVLLPSRIECQQSWVNLLGNLTFIKVLTDDNKKVRTHSTRKYAAMYMLVIVAVPKGQDWLSILLEEPTDARLLCWRSHFSQWR